MCMLCDQEGGQRLDVAVTNDVLFFDGLSIAPAELLDNGSVGVTRRATATDEVLDYYLHTPGGAVTVSGGGFGEQQIQSLAIPGSDQDYFKAMVRRLDSIIDLDFRQVDTASRADVVIYYDTEINLGDGGTVLGLATTSGVGGWELYLNYPALESDAAYRTYALIHEFGHSLGLEHPFEASDGDVFNGITDPWSSAYPEDTVMAYRSPSQGIWPEFFSLNDVNALIEAWGAERHFMNDDSNYFNGNNFKDDVIGSSASDIILGNDGSDFIFGRSGDDELRGGLNADSVRGGSGNDKLYGGRGHDLLFGGRGNDVIRGGYGTDVFEISEGNDVIEDFRISDNDQLITPKGLPYDLLQDGSNIRILTSLGETTLVNVNMHHFISQQSMQSYDQSS